MVWRGFDKQEVIDRIATLQKEISAIENKLKGQLNDVLQSNEELKEIIVRKDVTIASLRIRAEELSNELAENKSRVEKAIEKAAEREQACNKMASRTGEIIMAAQSAADSMVSTAQESVNTIAFDFDIMAGKAKDEIYTMRTELAKISPIVDKVLCSIGEGVSFLNAALDELQCRLEKIKLKEKDGEPEQKIDNGQIPFQIAKMP
jgi:chromosome segregation ATPase